MAEWPGLVNTTAKQYLKGAADHTVRKRLLWALLANRGRITTGWASTSVTWDVEYSHPPISAYTDGAELNFSRGDHYRQLELNWRGYKGTDLITEKELLMNDGDVAIVRRYTEIIPKLLKALKEKLGTELYVDGYAAGNTDRFHGIESFMGSGTTVAADVVAQPDDAYGGRNTDLADQGGTWTTALSTKPNAAVATDWPDGEGDPEYDYLTPLLVNWSSSTWSPSGQLWLDCCEEALRYAITMRKHVSGGDDSQYLALMPGKMYVDFKNNQASKQRIVVPHKESQDLGFPDTMNFDGTAVQSEFGVPTNTAYVFQTSEMEIRILGDEIFRQKGPTLDPRTESYLYTIGIWGQIAYNPKHFCKLKNYAS